MSPDVKVKTAIAAMIGLCVPVFWGFLALLFMHARLLASDGASVDCGAVDYLSAVEYAAQQYSASGERGNVWAGCVWVLADRELETEA